MSLSLCKHVYENNVHAVRVLYSLSVLQFTITLKAQDSLCTLKIAKNLDVPDLYAFRSRVKNTTNTGGSYLSNKILTKAYSKDYFQTKVAVTTMIIVEALFGVVGC